MFFETSVSPMGMEGPFLWNGNNGTLKNCDFINNDANGSGGGVCWIGANGTLTDSNFLNNSADWGGGIHWKGYKRYFN